MMGEPDEMLIAPVPALFAVQQAARGGGPQVLTLQFANAELNTELYLDQAEVLAIRSALVPSWRTCLLRAGISPLALAEARRRGASLSGVVHQLTSAGDLTAEELARLAHERLTSALIPLYWNLTVPLLRPGGANDLANVVVRTPIQTALIESGWCALALSPEERALKPSDRFKGTMLQLIDHPCTPVEFTWSAAQRGLSLGEITRRLPLRWDILTGHVTGLVARRLLKSLEKAQTALHVGTNRNSEPHNLPSRSA